MKNKFFYYLLLSSLFISCIGKQSLSYQVKNGLKKNPVKFLNQETYETARNMLLHTVDDVSLTSDTLIIIERIVDTLGKYNVFVYDSNTKDITRFQMQFDPRKYPSWKLVEGIFFSEISRNIVYALQQGTIHSEIEEIRKTFTRMPSPLYIITVGIKKNNKFEFQYYRII